MYGWRGRIGIIVPSSDRTTEMDFHELKPEGVAVYVSRVLLPEANDPKKKMEALQQMDAQIPYAAKLLAAVEPDIIAFCCTTGSFLEGVGTDKRIINMIESKTGVEAITTSTALIEALRYLGISKIDLLTPYNVEIGAIAREFLQETIPNLEIVGFKDLGIIGGLDKCKVSPYRIYLEAKELVTPTSEALLISCTALQTLPIINVLERDIGKPVITSNNATMWLALRKLGIRHSIENGGQLLRKLSAG